MKEEQNTQKNKVELHCHTRASDNSYTSGEIIGLCKQTGISHVAITDHDTTAGIAEAVKWGESFGVHVIPGIEISSYDYENQRKAHILGYFIAPAHEALEQLCKPLLQQRHNASRTMVEALAKAGYDITWEEAVIQARGGTAVYKQHIMHVLMDKGYCKELGGALYRKLFLKQEDGSRGIAYFPLTYIDVKNAIRAVRAAGGVPVLAHPGQQNNFDAVPEWVEWGLQGIETFHPSHDDEHVQMSSDLADKFQLIMTGGSDFHGFYGKSEYPIGSINAGLDCVEQLQKRAEWNTSKL